MPKLSDYVQTAATEYLLETGKTELDALWAAAFFQDSGVLEEYPQQNMVVFYNMVQKELTKRADRAEKQTRMKLEKISWFPKPPHKG
ncbi:MAG: hypothetical protein A2061_09500 [Gallionellales bacterium GWA2_59_43]|nr:MAG: hypothetical protein A2061_09500 [Gallionellales bacterium GWA2_59_43]